MLEKNKDYIEMRVSSTDFAFTQNEPVHLCVEGLVDATNGRFPGPGEDYILISKEKFEALQTENEQLKKKLEECEKDYRLKQEIKIYTKALQEWKEATGYPNPSSAKTAIESGASWCLAYNKVKKKYDQSIEIIGEWQRATGYFSPKVADEELAAWKEVTGCSTPEVAKDWVNELGEANGSLANGVLSWQKITGFSTPEKCSSYIDTLEEKLEKIKNLIEED